MSKTDQTETPSSTYQRYLQECVEGGWVWECACGEHHKKAKSAVHCKKCRAYLDSDVTRYALHLETGEHLEMSDLY